MTTDNTKTTRQYSVLKDVLGIVVFVALVILGAMFINAFIFRSFSVTGPSMEPTLHTNDRLIVNKIPVTWQRATGGQYIPERGDVVVFENPLYEVGRPDEFIVKRVVGFPGERVVVENGTVTVHNDDHPRGFHPDDDFDGEPAQPTTGSVDTIVPEGELFVLGDNRTGNFSLDSRNGIGTVPFYDLIGPVAIRIFPFTQMRFF